MVDNASSDNSLDGLPDIPELKVVLESKNQGFARGCNIGVSHAKANVFHFLNPDTVVPKEINAFYESLSQDVQRCIYSTQIQDMTGSTVQSSFAFPTLGNLFWSLVRPQLVKKWHLGASVIVHRAIFNELGGFSEDYFMYCEDTDLFYKALLAGISIEELPVSVRHVSGGSTRQIWTHEERLRRVENSALIFARKFNLGFSYFVFKHMAFLRKLLSDPRQAALDLKIYWRCLSHRE